MWIRSRKKTSGGGGSGGFELVVTCDAAFAGETITCTDGVTTLTDACPSSSPYEVSFPVPNGGTWTISGTHSGKLKTITVTITDSAELHSTPNGSTVLPTDDIQTWLATGNMEDKNYTTLNEVLADSTTLAALMSVNNAVNYLVRSTTFVSGICADSGAMTAIGANDYCADTLLNNNTWRTAICNSTYFTYVLNVQVPIMTSDTTPSGIVTASSYLNESYRPWHAFTGTAGSAYDCWHSNDVNTPWIQYQFANNINMRVYKIHLNTRNGGVVGGDMTFNFKRLNGGPVIGTYTYTDTENTGYDFIVDADNSGDTVRLDRSSPTGKHWQIGWVNFYGRLKVS